jgi:hypothetical protein
MRMKLFRAKFEYVWMFVIPEPDVFKVMLYDTYREIPITHSPQFGTEGEAKAEAAILAESYVTQHQHEVPRMTRDQITWSEVHDDPR